MKSRFIKTAFALSLITILSRFSGFFRDLFIAAFFGVSYTADSFFTAQLISGIIPSTLFIVLETVFLPILSKLIISNSKHEIYAYVNRVYTLAGTILFIVIVCFYIFTSQIVNLVSPNFPEEIHLQTVQLTKILLPVVFISLWISLDSVLLRNAHRYILPETIGLPMNLVMIGYLVIFSNSYGITGLAYSVVVATIIQLFLQYFGVRKLEIRFSKVDFDFRDSGLKRMAILILPVLIGQSIQYINFIIERILASSLIEGSVSALTLGNRLSVFVLGIVSTILGSIFYKTASDIAAGDDMDGFKKILHKTMRLLVFTLVPATVGMMVLYLPITQLVFERGAFDAAASELTGGVFFWFSLGLIGYAVREMLTRAFYAMQDTKTAMINGGVAVALNAVLCVVLTPVMEVNGLALSMSISGLFSALLLLISLRRKIGALGLKSVVVMSGKVVVASGVMGFVVWWIQGAGLFLSVAVGAVLYVGLVWLMRVRELDMFLGLLKVKLKR